MMIKHQGEVVAVEFTPKYRPGSSAIQRTVSVMEDAMNKKKAVLKDSPEVSFGGRTSLVMVQAGKMPVLTTPKAVVLLQDEQKGAVKLGIATSKWAMSPVKSNPSEAVAAAIVDAGKDQKEDMMTTLGNIIPETTQLELANMMSTRGKKAAIDITMAKMASSTEPLRSIPSPVAKMLTDETGQRPVSREKIAYQALGIKPPRASQIDSRFKTSLRRQITDILGVAGTVKSKSGRAQTLGQLPFIDNHIFITPQHINDFRQMLAMYHLIRERNAPFMELLVPGFSKDIKELIPLDKMIDYLMPSPDHMFRGERVMFFTTGPTPAQADPPGAKWFADQFKKHMLGLELIAAPAIVGQRNAQAATRFLRSFNSDSKKMFESVRLATSVLVDSPATLRFSEELGVLPRPQPAAMSKSILPGGVKTGPLESDYSIVGAFFERDRKGHRVALSRFTFPYLGYRSRKGEVTAGPFKDKIVQMGVTSRPKSLLKKSGKTPEPRILGPKGPTTGGSTPAGGQGPQAGAIGLIPLHNQGFTLPPIGWNRGWMIPVMQVMDEYWYMLGSSDSVKLEVHDLLYLIGNQAMESMGYEISAQEYLIILLLLGVFDSSGKSRETQTVELTLAQLEADDSAISKHIEALGKLKGEAVKVAEVTDFAKLTAEDEAAIAKAEAAKATEADVLRDALETAPKARRRSAKRVPSILPFVKPSTQGSVGTKYWDKAKIKSLTKASQDMIDSRITKKMEDGDVAVKDIGKVLKDSLKDMARQKAYLKEAEKMGDKASSRVIGAYALSLAELKKQFAEQKELFKKLQGNDKAIKKQVEAFAERLRAQTALIATKPGVASIIEPLIRVLIDGMNMYASLGMDTAMHVGLYEHMLAKAKESVEKGEIVTPVPKGDLEGFETLKEIQEAALDKSPSLTLAALEKWIKKNSTPNKTLSKELPAIKKIVEGIESNTYEEIAVQTAFSSGLSALMDPNKRTDYYSKAGKIKGAGITAVMSAVKNLPKAAEKAGVTGEAPLVTSDPPGKPAEDAPEAPTVEEEKSEEEVSLLEKLKSKEEGTIEADDDTYRPKTEVAIAVERKSAKRSQRKYKGVSIRKLKNSYKIELGSEDKEFKLLKQAKEYIDAMTDKRRSPVLDGHTCVYMVGKSPCGGLLYTMKANPPMHQCRTCGAKYRLEGA